MRTVEEVRRLRLLQLKDEHGTWPKLNALLELDSRDSTLSQYASKSEGSKTKVPKSMGSEMARRLEGVCRKPTGWMDTDPAFDDRAAAAAIVERLEGLSPHVQHIAYTSLLSHIDSIVATAREIAKAAPAEVPTPSPLRA